MIENIAGLRVKLLGDPHLGRSFLNGTPLHRRGDRERLQWADFERSLTEVDGVDVHVCMGDLFDKWTVPYTTIFNAAQLYVRAAAATPLVHYFIVQGNHDASRDLERVSAFKLFSSIVSKQKNIHVVAGEPLVYSVLGGSGIYVGINRWEGEEVCLVFIPWDPVENAAEMVSAHEGRIKNADCVFGHWDVVTAFASDNLIPAQALKDLGVKRAITGHDHNKRDMVINDLPVKITGSMQPYSFAEDDTGQLYMTLTLTELQVIQPEIIKDKCVRVRLLPGQSVDVIPDCLQWKVQRIGDADEEEVDMSVEFEGFSFEKVFGEVMDELKVQPNFRERALQKWDEEKAKQ